MWRNIRIAILLLVLLFVALNTYFDRLYSTDWDHSLRVAAYPINGDGSEQAERFIKQLGPDSFRAIEDFFGSEAREYGISLEQPIKLTLGPRIQALPPALAPDAGLLSTVWWSLRTRYWAWRVGEAPGGVAPDIKLFVLFHDPERSPSLPHSIGLQKGLFGIVNVFADVRMMGSNDTVVAHELLHTLGATDKYDARDNHPMHPSGYAEPDLEPLHPQQFAELMAGRIPLGGGKTEIPESLHEVLIGPMTAAEIGWRNR
jgi:hypothetical protein